MNFDKDPYKIPVLWNDYCACCNAELDGDSTSERVITVRVNLCQDCKDISTELLAQEVNNYERL